MKKFITKYLGLVTKEEIKDLKELAFTLDNSHRASVEEMRQLRSDFRSLRSDMKTLYSEVSSDIKRVDKKISAVKPILKVEDKEAVAFIKGILSKHDNKMNTQEFQLAESHRVLIELQNDTQKAVDVAADASTKINNVLVGLGLSLNEKETYSIENLRNILIDASINGENKAV